MQMNGMLELITVARYWKQWSDPRLIFVVNNNRDLAQVSWEMRIESGEPKFSGSQTLPDVPYARFAEMLGFVGIRVERPEDMAAGWDAVLRADRPAVLEVLTDANVPSYPRTSRSSKRARSRARWFTGDPDAAATIVQSAKSVLAGMFPGPDAEKRE